MFTVFTVGGDKVSAEGSLLPVVRLGGGGALVVSSSSPLFEDEDVSLSLAFFFLLRLGLSLASDFDVAMFVKADPLALASANVNLRVAGDLFVATVTMPAAAQHPMLNKNERDSLGCFPLFFLILSQSQ